MSDENDKSILVRMEEAGHTARRVKLTGTERDEKAKTRYEVVGEIARGGVGVVHHGRDNDVGRDVALKVLRDEHLSNPELVQRFVEEAQIGGQLQHPGIVPVYELGLQSDKRPFFAMKLVKGETLSARLAKRKEPSDERRALLAVFREVCRTMAYAHTRGVIHRDLKPSNIMIGNYGEVQVVDWGFAKVLRKGGVHDERLAKKAVRDESMVSTVRSGEGSSMSIAGSVMGTPAYMPPEQALGRVEDLDERSDLFSLGAILCEILTGRAPYEGTDEERMRAASKASLKPAHAALDACDADESLVALAKKCLQPLPKDRPASATVLADAVAGYITDAEGRAHRASVRALQADAQAQEQKRARRQTILVGGTVIAVVLVALAAYFVNDAAATERAKERQAAIETALQDAGRLRAAKEWDLALAAAQRAVELGHDGPVVDEIRASKESAAATAKLEAEDDAFLAELDALRSRWGRTAALPGAYIESSLDDEIDTAFGAAFSARFPSIDRSAERLAASRHAAAFAGNLRFWSWLRTRRGGLRDEAIDRLAEALEPGHAGARGALRNGNRNALRMIVAEEGDALEPAMVEVVACELSDRHGDVEAAVEFLARRSRLTPDDYWIHLRLARAARSIGRLDVAAQHATSALAVRPEATTAWLEFAHSLLELGDGEGAVAAYERVLELDSTLEDAREGLVRSRQRAALRSRLADARIGKHEPTNGEEALAFADMTVGRDDAAAVRFFKIAFEKDAKLGAGGRRYQAARAAVRAGGESTKEALPWLRADLEAMSGAGNAAGVARALTRWTKDSALAPIREAGAVTDELDEFWNDVADALDDAEERAK